MDRQIWFVRHAQSEYNKKKLFTGWHDPELTQHGIHIAHELKEELYGIKSVSYTHLTMPTKA